VDRLTLMEWFRASRKPVMDFSLMRDSLNNGYWLPWL
jgi:hypothetical protein